VRRNGCHGGSRRLRLEGPCWLGLIAVALCALLLLPATGSGRAIARGHRADADRPAANTSPWLRASYEPGSVRLAGPRWSGAIGLGEVGRAGRFVRVSAGLTRRSRQAEYRTASIQETFTNVADGVEQSFLIAKRTPGRGPLAITVPLSGLAATQAGPSVILHDGARAVGAYSGLNVVDAAGRTVPARMHPAPGGHAIVIQIADARARYPLHVDPTFNPISEVTDPKATAGDEFGYSVAVSGTTAVIGAPGSNDAYVYDITGGSWSQTATLVGPGSGDFGYSVAIAGSTIVVGDPEQTVGINASQGAAYVYAPSANTWVSTATLTAPDGAADDSFGTSVATSGATIAVGAQFSNNFNGTVYVYTSTANVWSESAELTPSDSGPFDETGFSVSISPSGQTIAAGALNGSDTGAAYVYTLSGSSWTQAPKIVLPVSDASSLPATVAASHSTVAVGDQYSGNDVGAAYVYTLTAGTWTPATTLTAADNRGLLGRGLAISGNTIVAGAFGDRVGNGEGAAFVFTGSGSSWTPQATPLTAADGGTADQLGFGVAISGTTIIAGAQGHGGGAAYLFGQVLQTGPTFTVTTTQDTNDGGCYVGGCSLRDAITAVDAEPAGSGPDTIQFDIPGSTVQTLEPATPLPAITHPVVIDGTSQPGYAGTPLIQIDGAGCGPSCDGLDVEGGQSTIRGLAVTGFSGTGIRIGGSGGNVVAQSWVGVSASSGGFDGNGVAGIAIIDSPNNQIGGPTAQDRVIAAGNGRGSLNGTEVLISGASSTGNVVEGNWIGVGSDGTTPSNGRDGVLVNNGAADNTIGGSESLGNLIFGEAAEGVYVTLAGSGNVISGNTIGANSTGGTGGYQGSIGITVQSSPGTTIGDSAAPGSQADTDNGNEIVGQTGFAGIFVNSSGTTIAGNVIGTDRTGTLGLGNAVGIDIGSGSPDVVGPGNTIADNSGTGVNVNGDGTQITGNAIDGNGNGIVTDGNVAAPVLPSSSPATGGITALNASIGAAPGTSVTVEFFASATCDASGFGEGTTYLGSTTALVGAGGTAPISVASALPSAGEVITATATTTLSRQSAPSTSGFSNCSTVVSEPDNTSWTNATPIALDGSGDGGATGSIDLSGEARWYKIPIAPGGSVQINLTNAPANDDLALFSDISQAQQSLGASSTAALQSLSTQLPGSSFSPSEFSPSEFSPSEFSPSEFSPSEFSPSEFSPSEFSPSEFSPSEFSPSEFSPSEFSPSVISPSEFSPSEFSPSEFSPSEFSPSTSIVDVEDYEAAQIKSLLAVSDTGGGAAQSISADTWNDTGYFYVRVNGANGAYDPGANFSLSVHVNAGACTGVTPSSAPLLAANVTVPGPSYQTLILTDEGRMTDDGDLAQMESDLQTFAQKASVNGTILDVGTISPQVAALQAQADADPACPYAENLVADAIRNVVLDVRAANPGLKFIVIVGDDHVIPFFRYADTAGIGPESGYVPPVLNTSASFASLESNEFLSQVAYGASTLLDEDGLQMPVPDLPVGRLVETPTEIDGMLQAYMSLNGGGVATPTSSLVTGYDFMTQSANAVEADLQAGLGAGATNDTLITNDGVSPSDTGTPPEHSWTAAQLEAALLGKRHDLIYLGGHFSANNTLAADYTTTMNAQDLANSSVNLENAIVFSAGCHSGYDIVPGDAVPGVTQTLDWTGAFAEKQATLIAGTGYQYGDTDFLAYSDQLYADFSHALRYGTGPVAVGTALVNAESTYLQNNPNVQGIDIKSLLEATLYGLPMLSVDLPAGRIPQPTSTSIVGSTAAEPTAPGSTLGLSSDDVTLSPALRTNTVQLESLTGGPAPLATYLSGPGNGVQSVPGDSVESSPAEPTLPLAIDDVSVPGKVLRGVGFIGGTYSDQSGITPLTGAPATDVSGVHSTFSASTFFPSRLFSVNYFGALNGGPASTQLMLTPAQYESDAPGSLTDIQRSYSSIGLRLFYSANTSTYGSNTPALAAPPTISQVGVTDSGGTVTFQAHVVGDPAAGIQQVWVTYTGVTVPANGTGEWQSLDLIQDPTDSTLWTGTLDGLTPSQIDALQFVVQAVNGVGLVSLDDNNGAYYRPGQVAAPLQTQTLLTPTSLTLDSPPADGGYGTTVPVSATLTSNGNPVIGAVVNFTIGAANTQGVTDGSGVAHATIQLGDAPGSGYQLTASYNGTASLAGTSASAGFTIDRLATTLALSVPGSAPLNGGTGISATLQSAGVGLPNDSVAFVLTPAGNGAPVIAAAITGLAGTAQLGSVPSLGAGTYTVRAYFGPGGPLATPADPIYEPSQAGPSSTFTVTGQAPTILSASAATLTIGSRGSFTVQTTGVPTNAITDTAFAGCTPSASLPSGVTFADNGDDTATLAGVPASGTAGAYTLCITASNSSGPAATQLFTLTVALGTPTTPTISNLPGAPAFDGSFNASVATTGDGSRSVTSSTTGVCTVSNATEVTFVGVGQCVLTAHVAQGQSFAAADGSAQSVNVSAAPTSLSTALAGGGQTGTSLSVTAGTAVSDQATLSGAGAAAAGGSVTYDVYSDRLCTQLVDQGSAEPIATAGILPASQAVTLSAPGTYYWVARYSGDADDLPAASACGAETETVITTGTGADLAVTLDAPSQVSTGSQFPVTLTVTNNGPQTAKRIVKGFLVPRSLQIVSVGDGRQIGRLVIASYAALSPGQSISYTIVLEAPASGRGASSLVGGALALGTPDPDNGNNFAAIRIAYASARQVTLHEIRKRSSPLLARLRASAALLKIGPPVITARRGRARASRTSTA
jgi:CSLREA domain-containing protein